MGVPKSFVIERGDTALVDIFRMYATYRSSLFRAFQAISAMAWLISVDDIETASQHRTMAHLWMSDTCATSAPLLSNSRSSGRRNVRSFLSAESR